jgi:hypothetical protein
VPTLPPPPPESTPDLIPVTGMDLRQSANNQPENWFINLSLLFIGIGLVLSVINKKMKY